MSALVCVSCGKSPVEDSPGCKSPHGVAGVSTEPFPNVTNSIKKKAAPRWRGSTAVYLNKEGVRYAVFHRTASGKEAWEHPYSERCEACA